MRHHMPHTVYRQSGQKPDFNTIVEQELEILFRIARQLTGNDQAAEDVVSQTLYQAAKAWEQFDGRHPRSWLITILRNAHYRSSNRQKNQPTVSIEDSVEPACESFWQEIDWKLIGHDLRRIMQTIPEEFRLVVAFCDIEGLTREEAAVALNVPIGTVSSRLYRGRKLLRALIIDQLGDFS